MRLNEAYDSANFDAFKSMVSMEEPISATDLASSFIIGLKFYPKPFKEDEPKVSTKTLTMGLRRKYGKICRLYLTSSSWDLSTLKSLLILKGLMI